MAKICMGTKLFNLRGAPVKGESGEHLSLGWACETALSRANDSNDIVEKVKRFKLAQMIVKAGDGEVAIASEDITKIKQCAGHCLPTDIAGTMVMLLEGEVEEPKAVEKSSENEKE